MTLESLEQKTIVLEKEIDILRRMLKNHTHSGLETSGRIEPADINSILINSNKYKVGGTDPETDGDYDFNTASGKVATITIKSGIITDIILTP